MYIETVCFPGCDAMNFETNLIFLIKPVFYMIKMLRKKVTKRAFKVKMSVDKNSLRPKRLPLTFCMENQEFVANLNYTLSCLLVYFFIIKANHCCIVLLCYYI